MPNATTERKTDELAARTKNGSLPRTFGRYVLFDLIGVGGMAEIYLAKARTTEAGGGRLVVVKQILPQLSADAKFAEAFVQEAKLAARLSHANVVQVFDLGRGSEGERRNETAEPFNRNHRESDDDRLFIAMEYVEGLDLNQVLRSCAKSKLAFPIEFTFLIAMEVLRGLDYAHRRTDDAGRPLGIVHRDVSPSNVLVSVDGEVKLCDFGIARANDVSQPERTGAPAGTDILSVDAIQGKAGYMSPEHARGETPDARSDVFAAGIILWELLAGRRMYRLSKDPETSGHETLLSLARRAEIPPIPGRELQHEDELHRIVMKALAVDVSDRYQSAAVMLDAVQRYVAKARMVASPIRLGEWLMEHFGGELVRARRARERVVKALELGPAAVVTPLAPPAEVDARTPSEVSKVVVADAIGRKGGTDSAPLSVDKYEVDALDSVNSSPAPAPLVPSAEGSPVHWGWALLVAAIFALGYFLFRKH